MGINRDAAGGLYSVGLRGVEDDTGELPTARRGEEMEASRKMQDIQCGQDAA